jgi:hypothetical protein
MQSLSGHLLQASDLPRGAGWIAFQQEARRPGRQRHSEENLADRIVQLTGQAVSLPGRG